MKETNRQRMLKETCERASEKLKGTRAAGTPEEILADYLAYEAKLRREVEISRRARARLRRGR